MSLKKNLIVSLVFSLAAVTVHAGVDEAMAAFSEKNYALAIKELAPLAKSGNSWAQFNLGVIYGDGLGVPPDYVRAASLYQSAAEQGNAKAQFNLGLMYDEGQGVPQNPSLAASWFRKAAEQELSIAQSNLGVMYANGTGLPKDYTLAYGLFNLSTTSDTSKDNPSIVSRARIASKMTPKQIEAGKRLTNELAKPNNMAKAMDDYFNLLPASASAHVDVDDWADRLKKNRNDNVAIKIKDITPLAESGNVKAQHDLGYLYASASGIAQNMTIAARWYQKAAEQGHPNAQFNLGYLYENGQGVPKDLALAEGWYKKSAKQGSVKAQTNLARMYVTDLGTPQDFPQAAYWFLKAGEQGDPSALNSLGYMYNIGQSIPQDYALAYALYNLAAVGHSMGAFAAANNRAHMMPGMTPKQIEAGGQLTFEISKPNNLTKAIDAYLKSKNL